MDMSSGRTSGGWQRDTLNRNHRAKDLWGGAGRGGLMELGRHLRGEDCELKMWRREEFTKTEKIGETLSSICRLTHENLPGGW